MTTNKPYKLVKQKDGTWTLKNLDVIIAPIYHAGTDQTFTDEDLKNAAHNAGVRKTNSGYYPPGQAFHSGDKDNKTIQFSNVDKARMGTLKDYPMYDTDDRLQPKDVTGMIVDVKSIPQIFKDLIYEGRFPHRSVNLQRIKDTAKSGGVEFRDLTFLPANKIPVVKLRPLVPENIEVIDDYPDVEAEFEDSIKAEFEDFANATRKKTKTDDDRKKEKTKKISDAVNNLQKNISKNYVDSIHQHSVENKYSDTQLDSFIVKFNELAESQEDGQLNIQEIIEESHNQTQGGNPMADKELTEALNRHSAALEENNKLQVAASAKKTETPARKVPTGDGSRIPIPIVEYESAEFEELVAEKLKEKGVTEKDGVQSKPKMTSKKAQEIIRAVKHSDYGKFADLLIDEGGITIIGKTDNTNVTSDGTKTFTSVHEAEAAALASKKGAAKQPKNKVPGAEFEDVCTKFGAPADSPMAECISKAIDDITPKTIQEIKEAGMVDEKGNPDLTEHIETSLRIEGFIQ